MGTRPIPFNEAGGDRAIRYEGNDGSSNFTDIGFITISTDGNENSFGTAASGNGSYAYGMGNKTRGIFSTQANSGQNIDYIEFSTKGNVADFGDLSSARYSV